MSDPVLLLPTKLLVDRHLRIREVPKTLQECAAHEGDTVLKVKMTGVLFRRDFLLYSSQLKTRAVVPGNKIVAKLHGSCDPTIEPGKYLIFPYSTCLLQLADVKCSNCLAVEARIADVDVDYTNYLLFAKYPCQGQWEYGLSIDGGLQDYIKVKSAASLIRVPDSLLSHDCCFLFDLALPFYVYVRDTFHVQQRLKSLDPAISAPEPMHMVATLAQAGDIVHLKILIVLHDVAKEANEVLMVLNHFGMDRNNVDIVDRKRDINRKTSYAYAFVFNCDLARAAAQLLSTGLEATKARYQLILFDQYYPKLLGASRAFEREFSDISITHFQLLFKDKLSALELINMVSELNFSTMKMKDSERDEKPLNGEKQLREEKPAKVEKPITKTKTAKNELIDRADPKEPKDILKTPIINKTAKFSKLDNPKKIPSLSPDEYEGGRPSFSSMETQVSSSAFSEHLASTLISSFLLNERRIKSVRFKLEESQIHQIIPKKPRMPSWFWYECDYPLCSVFDRKEEGMDGFHSVIQINQKLQLGTETRVCYVKRPKGKSLNAFLFQ